MSTSPVRLTPDEAAAVLRRAVELDAEMTAPGGGETIEAVALEEAAAEVGVSPDAVRQAVAELRAGALVPATGPPSPAASGRLVGPRLASDQRVLELTPEQALDRAGHVLRRQLFELRRTDTGRALWRRRSDVAASMQRVLDFTGRIKLSSADAVTVTAVPLGRRPGASTATGGSSCSSAPSSLVRVEADLANLRPAVAAGAVVPAALTWGTGTLVALVTGDPVVLVASGAAGAAAGGAGLGIGRSWYRRQHRQVAELLGWLLDQIGHQH